MPSEKAKMVRETVAKLKAAKVARKKALAAEEKRQKAKKRWEEAQAKAINLANSYDEYKRGAAKLRSNLLDIHGPEAAELLPEEFREDQQSEGSDWEIVR